jgi:hypothetical protein
MPSKMEDLCSWTLNFKGKGSKALATVGVAAILWTIWNVRNGACFRNIIPVNPVSIVAKISHYIQFWAGMQRTKLRDKQREGAKTLLSVANDFFHRSNGWMLGVQRLTN